MKEGITDEQREKIIKAIKIEVDRVYSAHVFYGLKKILGDDYRSIIPDSEIFKIKAAIEEDNKYIGIRQDSDGNYHFAKNPLYEFNKSLKNSTKMQVGIAFLTMVFIALSTIISMRQCKSEEHKLSTQDTMHLIEQNKYHSNSDSLLSR